MIRLAPAKINLWLKITGRRDDGYHLLESGFAPIDLFDEITIEPARTADKVRFQTAGGANTHIDKDTVTKVLGLFRQVVGGSPFLEVTVKKNIPVGAGLGGGSSDAGTLLRFLQEEYGDPKSGAKLSEIALSVGADVPFFLQSKPALVKGVGDVLTPLRMEEMAILLVKPPFSVATKEAYAWFDSQQSRLTHPYPDVTSNDTFGVSYGAPTYGFEPSKARLSAPKIAEVMHNDLEEAVEARHPEISAVKKALRKWGALGSLMSGSGSSVFGVFKTKGEAQLAWDKLQHDFSSDYSFFICRTLSGPQQGEQHGNHRSQSFSSE